MHIDSSLFKIEQIMLAPNEAFSISSFAALREAGKIPKPVMPKTQAEIVLRSFVMRGWLLQSKFVDLLSSFLL
jgi:hypothetical protein